MENNLGSKNKNKNNRYSNVHDTLLKLVTFHCYRNRVLLNLHNIIISTNYSRPHHFHNLLLSLSLWTSHSFLCWIICLTNFMFSMAKSFSRFIFSISSLICSHTWGLVCLLLSFIVRITSLVFTVFNCSFCFILCTRSCLWSILSSSYICKLNDQYMKTLV